MALAIVVKSIGTTEVVEGSVIAEEPFFDEVTTGVLVEATNKERPLIGEALEEPPAHAGTAAIKPEERLPVTTDMVMETVPLTESPI